MEDTAPSVCRWCRSWARHPKGRTSFGDWGWCSIEKDELVREDYSCEHFEAREVERE